MFGIVVPPANYVELVTVVAQERKIGASLVWSVRKIKLVAIQIFPVYPV